MHRLHPFFTIKAIVFYSLLVLLVSCKKETTYNDLNRFELLEKYYIDQLEDCSNALNQLNSVATLNSKKSNYLLARNHFKSIESILAFVDSENYTYLNAPNLLKVEEEDFTDIKIKKPTGFQVIEELLFSDPLDTIQLKKEVETTKNRIDFLIKNTSFRFLKPHHIAWIIRDAINRVALTGITGFDSPVLENSLTESQTIYKSLKKILSIFELEFSNKSIYTNWLNQLDSSISTLGDADFNSFDRFLFIKNNTHKELSLWNKMVKDWNLDFPISQPINYGIDNLFTTNTFNIKHFTDQKDNPLSSDKIKLGKLLFEDSSLSRDNSMSCATCHKSELYFTDGFSKSPGTNRNSPTLKYAALQKGFFHDKRTGSLEGQIIDVINNPNEFHVSLNDLEQRVTTNSNYKMLFKQAYHKEVDNVLIRNAIASYIMSLSPFNSKFDENMQGKVTTMTHSEINGFNLFMGKAKCATCHFAPLFNGLVPTQFKESELELIGVPKSKDTIHTQIDTDLGRYNVYQTNLKKHFFKTPTVRNIEKTAPYMHNGVYTTLEEVIEFYNRGGGRGLGIDLENQTLPEDKLNLTEKEKKELIMFLKTLTDKR